MHSDDHRSSEQGVVFLALLVLVVLVLLAGAFFYVQQARNKKPVSTSAAEVVEAGSAAIARNAQNTQRKNDAALLLVAVAAYQNANNGQLPTKLGTSMLQGMGYYSDAGLVMGEQDPLSVGDQLRLVTGARCLASGATAAGTSRQHAVQFSTRTDGGSFKPECIDG